LCSSLSRDQPECNLKSRKNGQNPHLPGRCTRRIWRLTSPAASSNAVLAVAVPVPTDKAEREAILAALEAALRRGDKSLVGNRGYRRFLKLAAGRRFKAAGRGSTDLLVKAWVPSNSASRATRRGSEVVRTGSGADGKPWRRRYLVCRKGRGATGAPIPGSPRCRPPCATASAGWSRTSSAPPKRCSIIAVIPAL
jgi:hypothetical protein